MKALVKVDGVSVGMFYQIGKDETQTEMHERILKIIVWRYGMCNMFIEWQN